MDTLAGEFSALTDATTAANQREAIARHSGQPHAAFERIIDDRLLANWRLCPHHDAPSRVRAAYCGLAPTQADRDREQRFNQALDELTA